MSNLAHLSDSVQLSLVSMNISFIYLFSPWVQVLLVLGYYPSPSVTLWALHVAPAFHELAKQIIISFVSCSQGFRLEDFRPSLEVSWMDLYCEFYDGRQGLEMCVMHLVGVLLYTDGLESSVTEG
jgi:hypothetical protein